MTVKGRRYTKIIPIDSGIILISAHGLILLLPAVPVFPGRHTVALHKDPVKGSLAFEAGFHTNIRNRSAGIFQHGAGIV